MNAFPDTGPGPDGKRTLAQWKNAVQEDIGLINRYLIDAENSTDRQERSKYLALAQKEARRLTSDIVRVGIDIWDLTREEIDAHRL